MKIRSRLMMSAVFMLTFLSLSFSAFAQEGPPPPAPPQGPAMGDNTMIFVSSEVNFDGKVVKGAPYSAQAVTETTRTLSDGNRIKHKTTASVYRDSEGRTRRDQELGAVGPWAMSGEPQQTIFINDPVAGVNYVLEPRSRTARKMSPLRITLPPDDAASGTPGSAPKVGIKIEGDVFTAVAPPPPAGEEAQIHEFHIAPNPHKGTTESLGRQTIEGVVADGTRTTMTIPAGEVGNEQPIQIVFEKWYSPELQTVVMSKHSDPFVGETIYRLTNIVRGEPSHALFEVPGDYTIKEMPTHMRVLRRKGGEEK
jgi:hypothetical protein